MIETVPTIEIVLMASTGTLLVGLAAAVWLWVRAEARREADEAERDRMTADRDQMADMRPSWALCGDCEWLVESHRQEMAVFNVRGERQAELMAAVHGALRTHARQKRRAAAAIWELWGERDEGEPAPAEPWAAVVVCQMGVDALLAVFRYRDMARAWANDVRHYPGRHKIVPLAMPAAAIEAAAAAMALRPAAESRPARA